VASASLLGDWTRQWHWLDHVSLVKAPPLEDWEGHEAMTTHAGAGGAATAALVVVCNM